MPALDFSKLNNIAYQGITTEAAKAEHDKLIEEGFTVVSDPAENPFLQAPEPTTQPRERVAAGPKPKRPPLKSLGGRDYRAMYRAACNFHERHHPAQLTADYWEAAAEDMTKTSREFHDDPFLMELLLAVYEELEREYETLRKNDLAGASGRPL
jgi:hypothetical protein